MRRWLARFSRALPTAERWWKHESSFTLAGRKLKLFVHRHNCGWPPARMTERAVELAVADLWLEGIDRSRLHELGAVTPFYWPDRVQHVVDPSDVHPQVSIRKSLFDVDLSGAPVLSMSTFEHVGSGEYNLPKVPGLAQKAFEKVFAESPRFLVTVPIGYNPELDDYLTAGAALPSDVSVRFLTRSPEGNDWREEQDPRAARLAYGFSRKASDLAWANSVAFVFRGELFPSA